MVDGVAAARDVEVLHDVDPWRALEPVLLALRGTPGAVRVAVDELRPGSEPSSDAEMEGVDPIHLDRERIPSARLGREVDGVDEARCWRHFDREDHEDRLAGIAVMPVDELGVRLRSRGGDRETPRLARGGARRKGPIADLESRDAAIGGEGRQAVAGGDVIAPEGLAGSLVDDRSAGREPVGVAGGEEAVAVREIEQATAEVHGWSRRGRRRGCGEEDRGNEGEETSRGMHDAFFAGS